MAIILCVLRHVCCVAHSFHYSTNSCTDYLTSNSLNKRRNSHSQQRLHLQHIVSGNVHDGLRTTLEQTHEVEGSLDSLVILRELSSEDVYHTWLWKLNLLRCSILHADEFVDAVRYGLGCAGLAEPTVCPAYYTGLLDIGFSMSPVARSRRPRAGTRPLLKPYRRLRTRATLSRDRGLWSYTRDGAPTGKRAQLGARQRSHSSRRSNLFSPRTGGWLRLRPDHG